MTDHKIGSREEWLGARLELLKAEKELTRRSDELARQRQDLPWVRIDKDYRFETDEGSASLADLFQGRSQPEYVQLIEDTPALRDLDYDDYDALVVVGGQSPMFTFRGHDELKNALREFYEADKVTSALCHGTAALIDVTLSDGSPLIAGKTITGFANVEEDFADQYVGKQVMPWHIEDAAKERGANYIQAGRFKPFAVRDGQLITGQQQYSGAEVAKLVIEALGT
jgi:putative intracellular protease/amidase